MTAARDYKAQAVDQSVDPIQPPLMLVQLSQPLAEKLGLRTLPYHVHEILIGFFLYHFIFYVLSPAVSRLICPKTYHGFNVRTRLNWNMHWVSMFQALFINGAALWVIFTDPERHEMDWKGRIWGYTPASGMVQGFAAGYFLWDLQVSIHYFAISGPGALLHAVGALAITCIGFKPFGNYYGLSFILYELSTPFLNVHWFCDKLGLSGSKIQYYNGIALLCTFFACRVAWGSYQSVLIYSDIYKALTTPVSNSFDPLLDGGICDRNSSGIGYEGPVSCNVYNLPLWLVSIYLVGNTALSFLNFYWFNQMIKAVRKRFTPKLEADMKEHVKKAQ